MYLRFKFRTPTPRPPYLGLGLPYYVFIALPSISSGSMDQNQVPTRTPVKAFGLVQCCLLTIVPSHGENVDYVGDN